MKDRRLFALLAAVALMLALYALPSPPPLERAGNLIPLTGPGQACLAIMAFAVTLWVTEAVPFAVTSLLVVLLIQRLASPTTARWSGRDSAIR